MITKPSIVPTRVERKLSVLFVDDDAAVTDAMSMFLAISGIDSVSAADGDDALSLCDGGFRPDIILSDYRLPRENGVVVVARLRKTLGSDIPVIMMTGDTSLRHIEDQKIANLIIIQKPVDPDALIGLIHEEASRQR